MILRLEIPGVPIGKGRPRFRRIGASVKTGRPAFVSTYTPQKTADWEDDIRTIASRAMAGRPPLTEALAVYVLAVFPVPQSWSRKKRAAALIGQIRPAKKPDADNVLKALGDSLNGIVFVDDSQIVDARITKKYGDRPRLVATVAPIGEKQSDRPADSPPLPLADAGRRAADA